MSNFLSELNQIARDLSERFTVETDEGDPGYFLQYYGGLVGNYPWIYVDFEYSGAMPLAALVETEAKIKAACEACSETAHYLSTTLYNQRMRCRLIYREDLPRTP
jgi:hypothetical protein